MVQNSIDNFPGKYLNPVYPRSFPDPFVLKFRGEYFAYCTDFRSDGKVFGVLRSRDLVNWAEIGGAMDPLDTNPPFYWAPEVTYSNGNFYLYYSVGNETLMEIRVAISDRPDGGFVDCGKKLTTEDFAIDAHIFTDDDGERYMFYATDFLTHSHIGTGTVVDKMTDFFTLEGKPRPVTRAKYDWQIYDPNRREKGGVRWHTVEGAFVLKRKGIYFEMFSGGNWQNISYGVSFAVTDDIKKDEEWQQFSDGENVLPILRTLPDRVVGPGHNSVVRGLNNRELFCAYHRWTENGRVLSIDRMDFAATRIFIKGPTYTPQVAPFPPTFADFFDGENLDKNWKTAGEWKISESEIVSDISEQSELICGLTAESFLCEFSLRAAETLDENSSLGFSLGNGIEKTFEFLIFPKLNQAIFAWFEKGEINQKIFALPDDFTARAFHLARVEVDEFRVKFSLDETIIRFEKLLEKSSTNIALVAKKTKAAFSGFAFTKGFEDLFDRQDAEIEKHEDEKLAKSASRIEGRQLFLSDKSESGAILTRGSGSENFEFVVNIRLIETFDENSGFGFLLLNEENKIMERFSIERESGNFYLSTGTNLLKPALPKNFVPENYHQFRFLKLDEKLILQMEENELGEIPAPKDKAKIAVFYKNSTVAFDMIRLTIL